MSQHPFIPYLRIVGKGRHGSRPLIRAEAREALGLVLDGVALPEQVSAFFVLIRAREETPEEAAGFVDAVRARLPAAPPGLATIDWGSYAGKRRQPPWFLLALLRLAQLGERVLLHGVVGPSADRLYCEHALAHLGIARVHSLEAAGNALSQQGLCYIALDDYCPALRSLLQLQQTIGLRTPLHSVARMLNPLAAPLSVHGVFHRHFDHLHQCTAALLGDPAVLAFRGEGGEAEIRPEVDTELRLSVAGEPRTQLLPASGERTAHPPQLELAPLRDLWRGGGRDRRGEQAVIATLAAVRCALVPQHGQDALAWAREAWRQRDTRLPTPESA